MTRLPLYLSLCLASLATPAFAQMTLSLDGGDASAALSISGPPNLSLSVEEPSVSLEAPPDGSPSIEMSVEEPSSSEVSHMSAPPVFSSSDAVDEFSEEEPSEPTGPAISSPAALQLFTTLCTELGTGTVDAQDNATAAGWIVDDPLDTGPYVTIVSGYQDIPGIGSADFWSSLETFPTLRVGYCRISFGDADSVIDFGDLDGLGYTGDTSDLGNGNIYGSWDAANHTILLAADRADGEVQFEFNVITPAAAK